MMGHRWVDRVPYLEEAVRPEVLNAWHQQGLKPGLNPTGLFPLDRHEIIEPDLSPLPEPDSWPPSIGELGSFRDLLNPDSASRLPDDWPQVASALRKRDHIVMLEIHDGLFLTLGVHGWRSFEQAILVIGDSPRLVKAIMEVKGNFAARLAERVLADVEIDAAIFSEPISDNHGPLISPRMYEDLVLRSYQPVFGVLRRHGVETIIFMTYGNARLLLPTVLKWGFNCLWAYEVNINDMDYVDIRREFGRDLRLIGGIDLDSLKIGKESIRAEVLRKVPTLLEEGGYVPLADGRIRVDVPYENYMYYRQLLTEICDEQIRSASI